MPRGLTGSYAPTESTAATPTPSGPAGNPAPGTVIHPEAITLTSGSAANKSNAMLEIEKLVAAREHDQLGVVDWWSELDLAPLGFELASNTGVEPAPYLMRSPGPVPAVAAHPELEISKVTTPDALDDFEKASFEGFEGSGAFHPGIWHASASLDHPEHRYFVGRVDGRAVSASISVVSDGVVGIFGVATIPEYRRRGYGTALTWAALNSAPDLPALLGPSDMAESLYREMGFDDFHRFRVWRRN